MSEERSNYSTFLANPVNILYRLEFNLNSMPWNDPRIESLIKLPYQCMEFQNSRSFRYGINDLNPEELIVTTFLSTADYLDGLRAE